MPAGCDFRITVATAIALLGSSCSSAQPADTETWRCDTPYGTYLDHRLPATPQTTTISGRLIMHATHAGPRWAPLAHIGFNDSAVVDGGCHCDGVEIQAYANDAGVAFSMLVDGQPTMISARQFGIPISFQITLHADNTMMVTIGKKTVQTRTMPIPHLRHDTVEMSCSSADVGFLDLEVR